MQINETVKSLHHVWAIINVLRISILFFINKIVGERVGRGGGGGGSTVAAGLVARVFGKFTHLAPRDQRRYSQLGDTHICIFFAGQMDIRLWANMLIRWCG